MTTIDGSPKLGDRRIVTAEELGAEKADQIIRRLTSPRAAPVQELLKHGCSANAIFAQQYVRSSHRAGEVEARTQAIAGVAHTETGTVLSAVYAAHFRAAFAKDDEALRHGTTLALKGIDCTADIFGIMGPWHVGERVIYARNGFGVVSSRQVDFKTRITVEEWMRGKELVWVKLPSQEASRIAAKLGADVEALQHVERQIHRAYADGTEPDEKLLRRYKYLKIGLEAYGIFIGYERAIEIEREPSLAAIDAMNDRL